MNKPVWSLHYFRERLSHAEALPQLVLLGVLSGIATAVLISIFRLLVDHPLAFFLGHSEGFENLPAWLRFVLPVAGSLVLLIILYQVPAAWRKMGVVHVLERMSYHQGHLPLPNMLNQLVCASVALVSGHSVGREGPAVHIGAACSSWLGEKLHLPNNSLRLLVGCGTAAAIAAAFNTPLAGVIFAMEVILLEYSAIGFVPIMVAAVTADVTNRLLLGSETVLDVPPLTIGSLAEVPFVMFLGFCIGLLAAGFNRILRHTTRLSRYPLGYRLLAAGIITGLVAIPVPQVMGIGYDTVSEALAGNIALGGLVILVLAKWMLTPLIIGLGIPAGFIGPTLFIGAMAGGALGIIGETLINQPMSHTGFYAMVGMGAMMSAVLNAPLAALTALLELTGNPNIILPGMIAIVAANVTVRYFFHLPSLFITALQAQGLDYRHQPLAQALSRAAVGSLMKTDFILSTNALSHADALALTHQPARVLIEFEGNPVLLSRRDLHQWLQRHPQILDIDLCEVPARRDEMAAISSRATLKQALDQMNDHNVDTLYVQDSEQQLIGLLNREQLEQYYLDDLKTN